MKLFKKMRKGFTLIELVVVIAVIAVLSAVAVVSYISITNRAKESHDNQIIDQVNLSLKADETLNGKPKTMHRALEALKEDGFLPANFGDLRGTAKDYTFAYSLKENKFVALKGGKISYPSGVGEHANHELWKIAESTTGLNDGFSYYLRGEDKTGTVKVEAGFDVGDNKGITEIKYTNPTGNRNSVIRTDGGTLTINAPEDTVKHFGNADSVNIVKIANASYHENGTVPFIQVSQGRVEIESSGDVNTIHVANVQTVNSDESISKQSNVFSQDVSLTLNGKDVKLSRDTIGTAISSAVLVCEVQEQSNSSSEYIWLVGDGTIENHKVYVTSTSTAPNTSVDSTTTTDNASDAAIAIANNAINTGTAEAPVYVPEESGKSAEEAQVASALKGYGTEADPFQVYDYATMQKISDFYYKGYYYFEVALDKTDNGKIDCSNWVPVYLNGTFNGKGVTFIGLDSTLFDSAWNSSLGNFTVKNAVVRQSSGSIVLGSCHRSTVHDVVVEGGYVEGSDRSAIFVGWGDATDNNFMEIKNCYSNATIVSGTSTSAAFVGHPYSDDGAHETTVIIDKCYYTGKIYNTDDTSPYFVAQSDNTVKVYLRNMNGLESYYAVNGVNGMASFDLKHTHTDANNETYYCQTNYSVKYTGEHGKINVKSLECAQNQGELVSITGANVSSSASYAKIEFLIAPNAASTESGSYQSVYVLEENVEVVNGSISASKIYNCAIQINGSATTATGYNSNKTVFNIVNAHYGKTHNGATAKFTEYDSNGNIIQIVNVTIAKSNSVGVMYNGKSIKNAALGQDYEFDTGLDLSNYDVKVVFVDRDSSWSYNFNYYAEFNGSNVADSTIPSSKYVTDSTFEVNGSKVIIHNIERKADRYAYGSLRYGIIVTEKSN